MSKDGSTYISVNGSNLQFPLISISRQIKHTFLVVCEKNEKKKRKRQKRQNFVKAVEDVPNKRIFDSSWKFLRDPIVVGGIGRKCIKCKIEILNAKYTLVSVLRLRFYYTTYCIPSISNASIISLRILNYDRQFFFSKTSVAREKSLSDDPILH